MCGLAVYRVGCGYFLFIIMAGTNAAGMAFSMNKEKLIKYLEEAGVCFDPDDDTTALRTRVIGYVNGLLTVESRTNAECKSIFAQPLSAEQSLMLGAFNKGIPHVAVLEPECVLKFLLVTDQLRNTQLTDERFFLQCLLPYTADIVADLLIGELSAKSPSYQNFKTTLLRNVGGERSWAKYKRQHVKRFQRCDESVPVFVQSVIKYHDALNLQYSEPKLVSIILENLTPEARQHRYGLGEPRDLNDLRELALMVETNLERTREFYRYNDKLGQKAGEKSSDNMPSKSRGTGRGAVASIDSSGQNRMNGVPSGGQDSRLRCGNCGVRGHTSPHCKAPRVPYEQRVCFRCKQPGHMSRFCPGSGNASPLQ